MFLCLFLIVLLCCFPHSLCGSATYSGDGVGLPFLGCDVAEVEPVQPMACRGVAQSCFSEICSYCALQHGALPESVGIVCQGECLLHLCPLEFDGDAFFNVGAGGIGGKKDVCGVGGVLFELGVLYALVCGAHHVADDPAGGCVLGCVSVQNVFCGEWLFCCSVSGSAGPLHKGVGLSAFRFQIEIRLLAGGKEQHGHEPEDCAQ